jgi:hypothetical protein
MLTQADTDRLRKLYALTDSPNEHEASNALGMCKALLDRSSAKEHGQTSLTFNGVPDCPGSSVPGHFLCHLRLPACASGSTTL